MASAAERILDEAYANYKRNQAEPVYLEMIPAGPKGPGGWSCHTFPDGETFPRICLAGDCPDRRKPSA